MYYFIYDGTFDGLLTTIYDAFYSPEPPQQIICQDRYTQILMGEERKVFTDQEKSDKVYHAIQTKISKESMKYIYHAYLSELPEIERQILAYLQLGFKIGYRIDRRLNDDIVRKVHQAARKVKAEAHRLKGLLRFRLLENEIYYAPVEPDHQVLTLLAPHFASRLADQHWIIHDLKRNLAVLYNQQEWNLTSVQADENRQWSGEENEYQDLWKAFYQAINIKERKNPRLQRQMMPRRYWKHLVEKEG